MSPTDFFGNVGVFCGLVAGVWLLSRTNRRLVTREYSPQRGRRAAVRDIRHVLFGGCLLTAVVYGFGGVKFSVALVAGIWMVLAAVGMIVVCWIGLALGVAGLWAWRWISGSGPQI